MGVKLIIWGILEITKATFKHVVGNENLLNAVVVELVKKGFEVTQEEAKKLLELSKQFDLEKAIKQLDYKEEDKETIDSFIRSFLENIDINELISDYGVGEKLKDALINEFDMELNKKENSGVLSLLGDKYGEMKALFSEWVEFIWKTADQNKLIMEKIAHDRLEEQREHREQNELWQRQNELWREQTELFQDLKKEIKEELCSSSVSIKDNSNAKNMYQEYKSHWTDNVFLNDDSGENAWMNMELKDIYMATRVQGDDHDEPVDMDSFIVKRLNARDKKRMTLILGQPGIGKSTFITYLLNRDGEKDDKSQQIAEIIRGREVLVYRFKDIKIVWNEDAEKCVDYIIERILKKTISNKILILDGFDEVYAGNNRTTILNRLDTKISRMEGSATFSLFVTCRENYISKEDALKCYKATLVPYEKKEILEFCDKYYSKLLEEGNAEEKQKYEAKKETKIAYFEKISENETELWGIPLILYMILATDIKLEKSMSKASVFESLFSLNGGIYDRAFMRAGVRYEWEVVHPMTSKEYVKKGLDEASKRMAFHIFENNPEDEYIEKQEFEKVCTEVRTEIEDLNDIELSSYFEMIKHTEGGERVQFIHKSIYEYFTAKYIFDSLEKILDKYDQEDSKKEFAKKYYECFKKGTLTPEIGEFLKFKILKKYDARKKELYSWLEDMLVYLTEFGFSYWNEQCKETFLHRLSKEGNSFSNFVIILQILSELKGHKYILESKKITNIVAYIKNSISIEKRQFCDWLSKFDLREVNLRGADFSGANLSVANLSGANLRGANLRGADLSGAHLSGANLSVAHLSGANLIGADLRVADLRGTKNVHIYAKELILENASVYKKDYREEDQKYLRSKGVILLD